MDSAEGLPQAIGSFLFPRGELGMHCRILHVIVSAVAVSSCAASSLQPSELTSADALARAVQQQGATVSRTGALPRSAYPFFSVSAQLLLVNGEDVQVFEYPNQTRVDSDASKVSPTGSPIGESQISWMDTPHFYKRDRLIVLYVGHAPEILKALATTLGVPFAAVR